MTATEGHAFIYMRLYEKESGFIVYTGYTRDIGMRQRQHDRGDCITIKRYNKSYKLIGVFYKSFDKEIDGMFRNSYKKVERRIKKLKMESKLKLILSGNWKRWSQ